MEQAVALTFLAFVFCRQRRLCRAADSRAAAPGILVTPAAYAGFLRHHGDSVLLEPFYCIDLSLLGSRRKELTPSPPLPPFGAVFM